MAKMFYLASTRYLIAIFLVLLGIGMFGLIVFRSFQMFGVMGFVSLVIILYFSYVTLREEAAVAGFEKVSYRELIAVEDIVAKSEPAAFKPTVLLLKIKNPLKTFGLRLRFRTYDYVNPKVLEVPIPPGGEVEEDVVLIPTGAGKRELSITIAPLFDEDGRYIPPNEADDLDDQKFVFEAEESALGGLSYRQRSLLSSLIRFALFFSASGIVYLSILRFSGLAGLIFVLTEVVPILMLYQVPVLMLAFYLDRKLPEKPTFVFEEE